MNTVIDEATSEVEVCVNLDTMLGRSVVVTAESQQKTGASNQATGKQNRTLETDFNYYSVCNLIIKLILIMKV